MDGPIRGAVGAIGTDVVDVARVATAASRAGFLDRVYTADEIDYCLKGRHLTALAARRLATRFAAKEAFLKAIGVGLGGARFKDIEIVSQASGAPTLKLHDSAIEASAKLGLDGWLVSLSHADDVAQAFVVGLVKSD